MPRSCSGSRKVDLTVRMAVVGRGLADRVRKLRHRRMATIAGGLESSGRSNEAHHARCGSGRWWRRGRLKRGSRAAFGLLRWQVRAVATSECAHVVQSISRSPKRVTRGATTSLMPSSPSRCSFRLRRPSAVNRNVPDDLRRLVDDADGAAHVGQVLLRVIDAQRLAHRGQQIGYAGRRSFNLGAVVRRLAECLPALDAAAGRNGRTRHWGSGHGPDPG